MTVPKFADEWTDLEVVTNAVAAPGVRSLPHLLMAVQTLAKKRTRMLLPVVEEPDWQIDLFELEEYGASIHYHYEDSTRNTDVFISWKEMLMSEEDWGKAVYRRNQNFIFTGKMDKLHEKKRELDERLGHLEAALKEKEESARSFQRMIGEVKEEMRAVKLALDDALPF